MDRFQTMAVFAKASELGSFAKTGAALNMSPPAVTRAISTLEGRLGIRLFNRSTRSLRLTEAGSRYLIDCIRILGEVEDAENAATGTFTAPRGNLTITASATFGQLHVVEIVRAFIDANPKVTCIALLVDRVAHLLDEGIDVAVRIGHLPDSSLTAIKVGIVRRLVCGAPSYFEKHGAPQHPTELERHRYVSPGGLPIAELRFSDGGKPLLVKLKPAISVNTNEAATDCALSGWALVRIFSYQGGQHFEAGRLKTTLEAFEPAPLPIHVVHREGRFASSKVRAFVDFAVERLRSNRILNPE